MKKGIKKYCIKKGMKLINHNDTTALNILDDEVYKSIRDKTKLDFSNEIFKEYGRKHVIDRKKKIKSFVAQLKDLRKLPFYKQRSQEWYDARKNILTASDLEEAIGTNCLKLAKKKAGKIIDNIVYSNIPPLKWGTMFEDMAARCYSQQRNDIIIYDFGLVIDESQDHFGASPDGINEHGIMIEIKCPFSRKIKDGEIPKKYYMQIQGQLATCCLEECDYIECDFEKFDNNDEYLSNVLSDCIVNHGIIAEYRNIANGEFQYIYSDAYLTPSQVIANIQKKVDNFQEDGVEFIRFTCWNLKQMNIQRVIFDKEKWESTKTSIAKFWEKVESCVDLPMEEANAKKKVEFIKDD